MHHPKFIHSFIRKLYGLIDCITLLEVSGELQQTTLIFPGCFPKLTRSNHGSPDQWRTTPALRSQMPVTSEGATEQSSILPSFISCNVLPNGALKKKKCNSDSGTQNLLLITHVVGGVRQAGPNHHINTGDWGLTEIKYLPRSSLISCNAIEINRSCGKTCALCWNKTYGPVSYRPAAVWT